MPGVDAHPCRVFARAAVAPALARSCGRSFLAPPQLARLCGGHSLFPQPPTVLLTRPLELPSPFAAPPFTAGVGPRYITRRPELSWSCTRHSAYSQIRVATGCGRRDARAVAGEVERGMWRLERQRGRAGSRAFARLRVRGLTVETRTNLIERLILHLCQIQRLVG